MSAASELPEVVSARGDGALVERIVAELGVATDAAAAVDAGPLAYLRHLGATLVRAVAGRLFGLLEAIPVPAGWPRALAVGVAATAVVLLALVVTRWLRGRRRAPEAAASGAPEVVAGEAAGALSERDAAAWRAELESLLAAGRSSEAVRALWWWLARALAGDGADPAWTGRELLERAGRSDLLPAVRRLETLTYGRRRAGASELRRLVAELEGAVP